MKENVKLIWKTLGFFTLALLWVFISSLLAGSIITGLPRPMQGEAPTVSRLAALGTVVAIQVAVPFSVLAFAVKQRTLRIAGFLSVMSAMLVCLRLLGLFDFLDKAWRRGI